MSKICLRCNKIFSDEAIYCDKCGQLLNIINQDNYNNSNDYNNYSKKNKNIFDYVQICFNKFFDFSGRARRSEYWYFALFTYLSGLILNGLCSSFYDLLFKNIENLYFLIFLGILDSCIFLIPNLSVSVRRLHDIGKSGWNLLLVFIPVVGPIILIIFHCIKGEPGTNKWGPNPKL